MIMYYLFIINSDTVSIAEFDVFMIQVGLGFSGQYLIDVVH